jgi:hypothetical protein
MQRLADQTTSFRQHAISGAGSERNLGSPAPRDQNKVQQARGMSAGRQHKGGKLKFFLFAACMAFCLALPCHAHDSNHPEFNQWYKQLRNSNIHSKVISCCSVRDCHETEAEIRGNQWWARVGRLRIESALVETVVWTLTEWRPVPDYTVLRVANPTGIPVICHSEIYEIWCFVPDNEY